MFCCWENLTFPFRHSWKDLTNLTFNGVYLLFRRPIGEAKIRYCEYCGKIKFVGMND